MATEPTSRSQRTNRMRSVLWGAVYVVSIAIAFFWSIGYVLGVRSERIQYSGQADIQSEFSLIDHTGQEVTQADYTDRWRLVFFGFTHCPDICPTTLAYMANVMDLLEEDADYLAPIFITVDPARDTVPVMAEYVSVFHPRLIGLTGTEAQVAETTRNFRTWYERTEDERAPDGYFMAHAGHIYLMRPSGEFEAVYQEGGQPPEVLAQQIRKKL